MRYAPALILLLAAAGCGVETDDRPVTFTYIHQAILVPSCATAACHNTQNHTSGVDMQDRAAAYNSWSGPTQKEFSPIYGQIGGEVDLSVVTIPDAGRMPLDSPLPEADILLIGAWIDSGGENN